MVNIKQKMYSRRRHPSKISKKIRNKYVNKSLRKNKIGGMFRTQPTELLTQKADRLKADTQKNIERYTKYLNIMGEIKEKQLLIQLCKDEVNTTIRPNTVTAPGILLVGGVGVGFRAENVITRYLRGIIPELQRELEKLLKKDPPRILKDIQDVESKYISRVFNFHS